MLLTRAGYDIMNDAFVRKFHFVFNPARKIKTFICGFDPLTDYWIWFAMNTMGGKPLDVADIHSTMCKNRNEFFSQVVVG